MNIEIQAEVGTLTFISTNEGWFQETPQGQILLQSPPSFLGALPLLELSLGAVLEVVAVGLTAFPVSGLLQLALNSSSYWQSCALDWIEAMDAVSPQLLAQLDTVAQQRGRSQALRHRCRRQSRRLQPARLGAGRPWLLPFLRTIRARPGMHIGHESTRRLWDYFFGYRQARSDLGLPEFGWDESDHLTGFSAWLRQRHSPRATMGVPDIIEHIDDRERNLPTFFREFEAYLAGLGVRLDSTGGPEPRRALLWGRDLEHWLPRAQSLNEDEWHAFADEATGSLAMAFGIALTIQSTILLDPGISLAVRSDGPVTFGATGRENAMGITWRGVLSCVVADVAQPQLSASLFPYIAGHRVQPRAHMDYLEADYQRGQGWTLSWLADEHGEFEAYDQLD